MGHDDTIGGEAGDIEGKDSIVCKYGAKDDQPKDSKPKDRVLVTMKVVMVVLTVVMEVMELFLLQKMFKNNHKAYNQPMQQYMYKH